jgi:Spy/CpxP family protein refolding chaperone
MKRFALWLAVFALLPASRLWSEEKVEKAAAPGTPVLAPGGGGLAGAAGKSVAAWYIENTDNVVKLTEDQKQAITKVFEAREQQTKDFQAKNAEKIKAASAALVAAYNSKDKDAIAAANKVYQELYASARETWKKSQAELMAVLTPEQRIKLTEHQLTTSVKAITNPVSLSDEQWTRIRAGWKEAQEGEWQKYSQVLSEVLTPEQKAAIAKYRLMDAAKGTFRGANLTAEQLQAIEAACDELTKGHTKLGLEPGMWGKVSEKINSLLTAEQKEAMKKSWPGGAPQNAKPAEK